MKYLFLSFALLVFLSCSQPKTEQIDSEEIVTQEVTENSSLEKKLEEFELSYEEVSFLSKDGLKISAYWHKSSMKNAVNLILCHQAEFSKSEYNEIAPKLNNRRFNCLAIDQRSGGKMGGFQNETFNRAVIKKLPVAYLNAEPDIVAAIDYISQLSDAPIILLGSSYSASLVLKIGKENDKVIAVVAFSPGEYFGEKLNLKQAISGFNKPLWVTSAKDEAESASPLISDIKSDNVVHFIPEGNGVHGARALWEKTPNHTEYWNSLTDFLEQFVENKSNNSK